MKNKEKFVKELAEFAINGEMIAVKKNKPVNCEETDCEECIFKVSLKNCFDLRREWAESEYIKPQVDWSKVKVDTPILVSNNNKTWRNRHFAKYEDGMFYAWNNGGDELV